MPYPMTIPQYSVNPLMPPMNFRDGGMASAAKNVQRQGRNGDSMLVHMTPEEVGGLQALARSQGGSLTINPETGLPEANFLKNMLPTILGIGGTFLGIPPHLTAMAVGGLETARTGDLGKGILAGLGAYGGGNLATSFQSVGAANAANAVPGVTEAVASGSLPQAATSVAPSSIAPTVGETALQASFAPAGTSAGGSFLAANPVTAASTMGATLPTGATAAGEGIRALGTEAGREAFINASGGYSGLAADVGMAASPALFAQPEFSVPAPKDEGSNYEGPYTPSERRVRYPTDEERRRSSEFTFFTPSNPVPFAEGGNVEDRSVRMPGASYTPGTDPEFNYNFQPVGIEGRNQLGMTPEQMGTYAMGDMFSRMSDSISGPFGRVMGMAGRNMRDSVDPYVDLSTYQYDPQSQRMMKGMAQGGLAALKAGGLREGAFIIPADVISHLGNGSSEAGMKIVRERLNARPIKGPGDGMSDSIPTTIAGRQKARVANEEAEIPPEVVASLGNGSMEKGAKKLFAMMDEVRQARTGKKKQAPQIRADKHVPA
jgi:hypothetical protein